MSQSQQVIILSHSHPNTSIHIYKYLSTTNKNAEKVIKRRESIPASEEYCECRDKYPVPAANTLNSQLGNTQPHITLDGGPPSRPRLPYQLLVPIICMESSHEFAIPDIFKEEVLIEFEILIFAINVYLVGSDEEIFHFSEVIR